MQGPFCQIFVEFLERSCIAKFTGFLFYKELGRRLKVRSLLCFYILGGHFHEHLVGMCSCSVFPCSKPTRCSPRSSQSCPRTRHAMASFLCPTLSSTRCCLPLAFFRGAPKCERLKGRNETPLIHK
jgi:hypothetical protein